MIFHVMVECIYSPILNFNVTLTEPPIKLVHGRVHPIVLSSWNYSLMPYTKNTDNLSK